MLLIHITKIVYSLFFNIFFPQQCVVLTEIRLPLQKKINEFCRSQCPPIKVIASLNNDMSLTKGRTLALLKYLAFHWII